MRHVQPGIPGSLQQESKNGRGGNVISLAAFSLRRKKQRAS